MFKLNPDTYITHGTVVASFNMIFAMIASVHEFILSLIMQFI